MNNAKLYQNANGLQRQDAEDVIKDYVHLMEWSPSGGDEILDIGCGDGDVMVNILLKHLPKGFRKITGMDLSPKMIKHASATYVDPRIDFRVLDITDTLNWEHCGVYSHIFSFNCLHWVQNQRKAVQNIWRLLKPGGSCIISFGAKNPIFDAYKALSEIPCWAAHMKDIDKFLSPYQYVEDPAQDFKHLMILAGFKDIQVECKLKTFYFSSLANLKDSVFAVNPFLESIPPNLHDDYFDDYLKFIRDANLLEDDNNNIGEKIKVKTPYHYMTAFATKSP